MALTIGVIDGHWMGKGIICHVETGKNGALKIFDSALASG